MDDESSLLPLFPLGTALVPGMVMPLHLFEPRYRLLAEHLRAGDKPRRFGIVGIRAGREVGDDVSGAVYRVGTVAEVTAMNQNPDGTVDIETVGSQRFLINAVDSSMPYLRADVEYIDEPLGADPDGAALRAARLLTDYRDVLGLTVEPAGMNPQLLSYVITASVVADPGVKQRLLAAPDTTERLIAASDFLAQEVGIIKVLASLPATDLVRSPISAN